MRQRSEYTQAAILAYLGRFPEGTIAAEIAAHHGMSMVCTQHHLRAMRALGMVCFVGSAALGRWCAPCHLAMTEECLQKLLIERREARNAIARARRPRRERRDAEAVATEWCEKPPVRRIVPAAEAKPLRVSGPNSVWALA